MAYEHLLENSQVHLRALEPNDVNLLYDWENNTKIWDVSSTIAPFSKNLLEKYIENSYLDIYESKQLRLMIDEKVSGQTVGTIDLYEFDANAKRAGIGILVIEEFQQKHIATAALDIMLNYCKSMLLLHQVYVDVPQSNTASLKLFQNAGFEIAGTKKDWMRCGNEFSDVIFMQKIL